MNKSFNVNTDYRIGGRLVTFTDEGRGWWEDDAGAGRAWLDRATGRIAFGQRKVYGAACHGVADARQVQFRARRDAATTLPDAVSG